MEDNPIVRGRGKARKTINQTTKRDLNFNALSLNTIHDKTLLRHLIHVINPTKWEKALVFVVIVVDIKPIMPCGTNCRAVMLGWMRGHAKKL